MAEELKKAEELKEVKAEPVAEVDKPEDVKKALLAFIFSVAGFVCTAGALLCTILGIVSLVMQKKISGKVEKKPHAVFLKVAKPVAIVDVILGALVTIGYIVWIIVVIVLAAIAASESGGF